MSCNETVLIGVELNVPGANYHFGRCLSPVSLSQATFRVSSPMGCAPKPKPDSPRALPIKRLHAMQAMKTIWNVEIAPSSN